MNETLNYYKEKNHHIDLVVILGNAVNGSQWDGEDQGYFQDRWHMLMKPMVEY